MSCFVDGSVAITGAFSMVSGFYAPKIFKSSESVIFPSYSPPEVYNPGAKTGGVPWGVRPSLVSLPDNSALIYGDFTDLGGFGPQQGLAKLEPSGYMVTTFTPDPSTTSTNNADLDHEVRCCVQQRDGNILLAGRFDKLNSQAFPYLARVTPTGELDTAFTTSGGFVGPTGQLAVYTSLYSTTGGAVWGTAASITPAGAAPTYRESTIAGSMNWIKYPQTTGHTYVAGFGPLALNVIGARYETSTTGTKVLGADTLTNDVQLSFTGARVELGPQNPSILVRLTDRNAFVIPAVASGNNPAATAVGAVGGTGLMTTLSFALIEDIDPGPAIKNVKRSATGSAIIVRNPVTGAGTGYGFFTLLQSPGSTSSDVLSGRVRVTPAP